MEPRPPDHASRSIGLASPRLVPKSSDYGLYRSQVAAAEEADVDKERVEVVDVFSGREKVGIDWVMLAVAIEECAAKGIKEGDEREFDFGVPVINGGIDEADDLVGIGEHVGGCLLYTSDAADE